MVGVGPSNHAIVQYSGKAIVKVKRSMLLFKSPTITIMLEAAETVQIYLA